MMHEADQKESPTKSAEQSPLATPVEVAKMLQVPPTWVYAHQNELPGLLRLGRYVRFRRTAIEQFLLSK